MAHHFSANLDTWKRRHESGGAVLRFYGIHLLALLADKGYRTVKDSALSGARAGEPERWMAQLSSPGLPDCVVHVDSRSTESRLEVLAGAQGRGGGVLLSLTDAFGGKVRPGRGGDRRIGSLVRLLGTFRNVPDSQAVDLYRQTNRLWGLVEATHCGRS